MHKAVSCEVHQKGNKYQFIIVIICSKTRLKTFIHLKIRKRFSASCKGTERKRAYLDPISAVNKMTHLKSFIHLKHLKNADFRILWVHI